MRERVELLLGRSTRGMWVLTFHAACTRMLRVEAPRLGYTRQFTIYDQADSRRLVKQCLDELGADPKRFSPARRPEPDLRRQEPAARRRRVPLDGRLLLRADRRRRLRRSTSASWCASTRWTSTTCWCAPSTCSSCSRRSASATSRPSATSSSTSTRTPTTPSTAGSRCSPASSATSPSSATTTSRSTASAAPTSATSSTSSRTSRTRTSSSSSRTTARRRRSSRPPTRSIAHNRDRSPKELWTEVGERRPDPACAMLADEHAEARWVLGEIERLVDEGVSRSEIAVFYRTNAQSRVLEDALVRAEVPYQVIGGTKFYDRAEIKDAIAYLVAARQPRRPGQLHADRQQPAARHRPDLAVARDRLRGDARRAASWTSPRRPRRCRGWAPRRSSAIGRFMDTMDELRALAADGAPGRRAARGGADRDRLPRRARGRADVRGAGADREPRGAGRRRARVRRERERGRRAPLDAFLAQIALRHRRRRARATTAARSR